MPAIAAIAIADGESSPVTHTFSPQTTNGQAATLVNRSSGHIPATNELLTTDVRVPQRSGSSYAFNGSLFLPVEWIAPEGYALHSFNKFNFTFNFSPLSTAQQRKNAVYLAGALLAHATIRSMAENMEPQY